MSDGLKRAVESWDRDAVLAAVQAFVVAARERVVVAERVEDTDRDRLRLVFPPGELRVDGLGRAPAVGDRHLSRDVA